MDSVECVGQGKLYIHTDFNIKSNNDILHYCHLGGGGGGGGDSTFIAKFPFARKIFLGVSIASTCRSQTYPLSSQIFCVCKYRYMGPL